MILPMASTATHCHSGDVLDSKVTASVHACSSFGLKAKMVPISKSTVSEPAGTVARRKGGSEGAERADDGPDVEPAARNGDTNLDNILVVLGSCALARGTVDLLPDVVDLRRKRDDVGCTLKLLEKLKDAEDGKRQNFHQ